MSSCPALLGRRMSFPCMGFHGVLNVNLNSVSAAGDRGAEGVERSMVWGGGVPPQRGGAEEGAMPEKKDFG